MASWDPSDAYDETAQDKFGQTSSTSSTHVQGSMQSVSSLYLSIVEADDLAGISGIDGFSRMSPESLTGKDAGGTGKHRIVNDELRRAYQHVVVNDDLLRLFHHDAQVSGEPSLKPRSAVSKSAISGHWEGRGCPPCEESCQIQAAAESASPSSWLDPGKEFNNVAGLVNDLGDVPTVVVEGNRRLSGSAVPTHDVSSPPTEPKHDPKNLVISDGTGMRNVAEGLAGLQCGLAVGINDAERQSCVSSVENPYVEALLKDPSTAAQLKILLASPSQDPASRMCSVTSSQGELYVPLGTASPSRRSPGSNRGASPFRGSRGSSPSAKRTWGDEGTASPVMGDWGRSENERRLPSSLGAEVLAAAVVEEEWQSQDAEGLQGTGEAGEGGEPGISFDSSEGRQGRRRVSLLRTTSVTFSGKFDSFEVDREEATIQGVLQGGTQPSKGSSESVRDDFGLASWASKGEGGSEPTVGWGEMELAVRKFTLETGGGHGVWLRDQDGLTFGLGVEQPPVDGEGLARRREGLRISMPAGFAEGRDVRKLLSEQKRKQRLEQLVRAPYLRAVAFGRLSWDSKAEPVQYVRCSVRTHDLVLPELMRFFAERVWGLRRPGMILSVVGSNHDLDLRVEHRHRLGGIMSVAAETGAWVTTAGFDSGVSRLMAQLRLEADSQVLLIGFAPWGLVAGRHALWEPEADGRVMPHTEKLPLEDFQAHEKHFDNVCRHQLRSLRLNSNHSHVFLVDDGTVGDFSSEAKTRAAFETSKWDQDMHARIRNTLVASEIGWQLAHLPDEGGPRRRQKTTVPAVGLCVGGNGSVMLRLKEMLKSGTPVLLVKGTGGVAELLADLVNMLRFHRVQRTPSRPGSAESPLLGAQFQLDSLRRREAEGFGFVGGMASRGASAEEEFPRLMSEPSAMDDADVLGWEEGGNLQHSVSKERCELLAKLLCRPKDGSADPKLEEDITKAYAFRHAFRELGEAVEVGRILAASGLCHVFDLDHSSDLPGAILAPVLQKQREAGLEWKDCLQMMVQCNHVTIMKRALGRLGTVNVHTRRAVEEAFHLAFKRNKTEMAYCLLEYLDCSNTYNIRVDMSSMRSKALLTVKRRHITGNDRLAAWGELVSKALRQLNEELTGGMALERWAELHEVMLQDEHVQRLLSNVPMEADEELGADPKLRSRSSTGTRRPESALSRDLQCKRQLKQLEGVYRWLGGKEFSHSTSEEGPMLDLFLWSVRRQTQG